MLQKMERRQHGVRPSQKRWLRAQARPKPFSPQGLERNASPREFFPPPLARTACLLAYLPQSHTLEYTTRSLYSACLPLFQRETGR